MNNSSLKSYSYEPNSNVPNTFKDEEGFDSGEKRNTSKPMQLNGAKRSSTKCRHSYRWEEITVKGVNTMRESYDIDRMEHKKMRASGLDPREAFHSIEVLVVRWIIFLYLSIIPAFVGIPSLRFSEKHALSEIAIVYFIVAFLNSRGRFISKVLLFSKAVHRLFSSTRQQLQTLDVI
ncbi:unnamed protein product [Albugo candida]|uniref:Uncharacterized protein n=1 Tax=Albugo candida TaxID=65357 RepID=A0A024GV31_9STRA|nr:unnamed protein product [Albugo candida]|eukprot:CCI50598.1 unnamed protein product [Albugo candida]